MPGGNEFLITATCEGGHVSTIQIADVSQEMAVNFAEILDGTSGWLRFKLGPESRIGKCRICGKPFRCTVESLADRKGG